MKNLKPEIIWREIDSIRPYEHNNKKHPSDQIERIAQSIKAFGLDQPLVLDQSGVIVKGEGRWLALRQLGYKSVPTIIRDDLSPAEVKASRIADNRSAISEFDFDALSLDLTSLSDEGYDLSLTGWTPEELSDIAAMSVPGSMEEIDGPPEREETQKDEDDETLGWEKLYLKLPPETMQVFQDLMHRCKGKPHEQFDALLGAVDVMALEELARTEMRAKR